MKNAYENMERVNEDLIKKAAVLSGPDSSFYTALEFADEYRRAGLTPVFLLDDENMLVIVTNEEKLDNKFS
jgi:hypothetical protein